MSSRADRARRLRSGWLLELRRGIAERRQAAARQHRRSNATPARLASDRPWRTPQRPRATAEGLQSRAEKAPWLFQLLDQSRNSATLRFEVGKGRKSASGIRRGCTQKLGELLSGSRRETAERPAGQASDLAKRLLADRIVTFLKHERLDVTQAELSGTGAKVIESLFHRIADKHQDGDLPAVVFPHGVVQNFGNLGVTAAAIDA